MEFVKSKLESTQQTIDRLLNKRSILLGKRTFSDTGIDHQAGEDPASLSQNTLALRDAQKQHQLYTNALKSLIAKELIAEQERSFEDGDASWVRSVTHVNIASQCTAPMPIDTTIQYHPDLIQELQSVTRVFCMVSKTSRCVFVESLLRSIVTGHDDFHTTMRIFPSLELTVESMRGSSVIRKIHGKVDYGIGRAQDQDMFCKGFPQHVCVAVHVTAQPLDHDALHSLSTQMACLHKLQLDRRLQQEETSHDDGSFGIWGILTNAEQWQFLALNEHGPLQCSCIYSLNLKSIYVYEHKETLLVIYQLIYSIVKRCMQQT